MIRRFFEELDAFLQALRKGQSVVYSVDCLVCCHREECARALHIKGDDGVWHIRWLDGCSEGEAET